MTSKEIEDLEAGRALRRAAAVPKIKLAADLEGSQLTITQACTARDTLAAELAQLKGKMAADKKVMDELSDAAARGRNLEVT